METNAALNSGLQNSWVTCQNSHGLEIRATLVRITRHLVVFEIYSPTLLLQVSEVLSDFKIYLQESPVYSGRAVIRNLVYTGTVGVCEATLEDSWLEVDLLSAERLGESLRANYHEFSNVTRSAYKILPEFKLVVADMQIFLMELRQWLEQVELRIRSHPDGDRHELERSILQTLQDPVVSDLGRLFEKFEYACEEIDPELRPAHSAYVKRQLHPLVLCAPFMYRTFAKPLGYPGDYEMVSMMLRSPYEGGSVFAKLLNTFFLNTPPVAAHRNRIQFLTQRLIEETCRFYSTRKPVRFFNLGCGPAQEVQNFLAESSLSQHAHFTLVDFNEETLQNGKKTLSEIMARHGRTTTIQMVKKSVAQLIKEASRPAASATAAKYDIVYCAGLFDYLPTPVCERLMEVFYEMVTPGGLLLATNVDSSNPAQNWMEYSVDWHLIYRNQKSFLALAPKKASPECCKVQSDMTGVNIYLEVRRPPHG